MVVTKYLGAAYGRGESNLKKFVEATGLPFLPTPMGKGVLSDNHPQCVAAARSRFIHILSRNNEFKNFHMKDCHEVSILVCCVHWFYKVQIFYRFDTSASWMVELLVNNSLKLNPTFKYTWLNSTMTTLTQGMFSKSVTTKLKTPEVPFWSQSFERWLVPVEDLR